VPGRERQLEKERLSAEGTRRGCLFCRKGDGGFTSEEHLVAECMGNSSAVLPVGVVCDRCNNGKLSKLDQALCEFWPIKIGRTWHAIPSKSGNVPTTRFARGTLRNTGEASLAFDLSAPNDRKTIREHRLPDGRKGMDLELSGGRRLTAAYASMLSRALLKTALEVIWLEEGEGALDESFDYVRDAVLGKPRDGYFIAGRSGKVWNNGLETHVRWDTDPCGRRIVTIVADYFGAPYMTDSFLPEPAEPLSEEEFIVVRFRA
jgi:hypothetical protein